MISACTLSLLSAAAFLAAALVKQDSCDYPPRLESAELMDEYKEKDFFPAGSIVKYKCRPGYVKISRLYSITCNRNQQWSNIRDPCKRKTCGHPGEPDGGRLLVTDNFDFHLGSIANYQCNEGHRLIGQSTRRCKVSNNKMSWTDQVPYCEIIPCLPPPNIPHGKHNGMYLKEFYYGIAVTYTCDKGYPLTGNASIYCTSKDGINGEWSGRAYCGVPQCPSPQIKNGRIVAGVSSTYKYNQKISFECIGGHNMVGSKVIYCQMDGTWNPPIPVCESGRQCPPPPDIQNGIRSNQETGIFPSGILVKYTCNPGYVLIGAATLHCTNAGRWSSPAPNCKGKSCGHPGEPKGGRLLVTGDFHFGSTVNYQCEEGYRLIGKSSRSCALFGKTVAWTGDLPYCQMTQCPSPQIKNGRIVAGILSSYKYNQKVSIECIGGHKMVGSREIHCQVDGTWDPPIPVCEQEIECRSPPDIQNGVHSNQEVMVFKRGMCVKYTCNFGYTLIGDATIHCTDSGTWTFPAPHCEKSQCPFPPSITNGKHDGLALQMFTSEMAVTYSCDPGYLLVGKASISCGPSGTWSLPVPSCEIMHCLPPPKIIHGKHVGEDFTYGKSVIYICDAGYSCIGNYSVTCIWNSSNSVKWSEAPRCQGCLAPQSIAHSKRDNVTLEDFPYGSSVRYHCDPGFFLIGAPTIYCQTSGTWDQPVPQCKSEEYMEAIKQSDSQVTKDGNNQIEKIIGSFIKSTIHSKINKTTTKDLATTLTLGLGGEPDIQRFLEPLNGGSQRDLQKDAFPEVRNCSGEDGCTLPPLSDSREAEIETVIHTSAKVTLECENGYVRNDTSPIQAQQIGWDAPVPACTSSKQSSYNFATLGFGSVGSILLLVLIFGGVIWIVLLQKKKRNCTCEAQRKYCADNYEDSPL